MVTCQFDSGFMQAGFDPNSFKLSCFVLGLTLNIESLKCFIVIGPISIAASLHNTVKSEHEYPFV